MGEKVVSDDILKKLLTRKDPNVKIGDPHKEEFALLLWKPDNETEFIETSKTVCIHCNALLKKTDGGHFTRHLKICRKRKVIVVENTEEVVTAPEPKLRKMDYYNVKRIKQSEMTSITDSLAKYCLRSGRSYNHMVSEPMKTFVIDILNSISSGYGEDASKQLPSRNTVKKVSEEMSRKLIKRSIEFIRPFVAKGRVNLLLDHGKHVVNYLSVYASFVDDNFQLQIVPLAFIPATEGKSGSETAKLVINRLVEYGWKKEEVTGCTCTADGALGTLSGYFKRYIRCVSHSISLIGANGVNPLKFQRRNLEDEEIDVLQNGKLILELSEHVSSAVRSNAEVCQALPKLPSLPGETRWLSSLKCLKDILELEDSIREVVQKLPIRAQQAFRSVTNEDRAISNSIIAVFEHLIQFNLVYQNQSCITMHLVMPSFKLLEKNWKKLANGDFDELNEDELDIEYIQTVSKNALLALRKYYDEFTDYHLASTMLSPRTKKMKSFNDEEIQKAKSLITSFLPKEPSPPPQSSTSESRSNIQNLLNMVSDEVDGDNGNSELSRFLAEHVEMSVEESIEMYWRRKKVEFPALSEAAANIYSVVPSESICETCFSKAGFLLDKRRTRLSYTSAELIVVGTQLAAKYPEWV